MHMYDTRVCRYVYTVYVIYIHKGVHVCIMYACMRVCACVTCRLVTYVCMHACMYMYDVHMCLHTYVHWWKHMYMICILLSSHHHLFFLRQSWNACASNRRHSKQHPTGLWTRKKRVRKPCALTKTKRCWLNTLAEKTSETFFSCGRSRMKFVFSHRKSSEAFPSPRNHEWSMFLTPKHRMTLFSGPEITTRTISRAPSRRNH